MLTMAFTATALLILQPWIKHKLISQNKVVGVLAGCQFAALLTALVILMLAMIYLDLSLAYVVEHNSVRLPLHYRISGTWGGHEGSLLLWTTIFSGWSLFFWLTSGHLPAQLRYHTLAVTALTSLAFQFLLFLKPPFSIVAEGLPDDGRGLNPLLQDPGLAIHPPSLYMGYGGISLIFALTLAALWLKLPVQQWLREIQQRSLAAWGWLTLGIALGSWWAYRELGWGGWWFWDPVENVSLMPWLTLTAVIHAAILSKRGVRAGSTTAALIILTQVLMLTGLFIVRSGVLASVHTFSSAPALGVSIISLITLTAVAGYLATVFRPPVDNRSSAAFQRPDILLAAVIILLLLASLTVLFGTIYPLIVDTVGLGKISVGPAYFNSFFVPVVLTASALLAISLLYRRLRQMAVFSALGIVLASIVCHQVLGNMDAVTIVALTLAFLIFAGSLQEAMDRSIRPGNLAHIGLALALAGGTLSDRGSSVSELRMWPYQTARLGEFDFEFTGTTPVFGPNYFSDYGFFDVHRDGRHLGTINPEKRLFPYFGQVMTETDQLSSLEQDLYITLGEPFDDGSWAVRLKVLPFISLLWLGAFFMVLGSSRISALITSCLRWSMSRLLHTTDPGNTKSGEQV